MIKKILKLIGITSFIIFSFFYTDKVINVIQEEDEIMIKLKSIESNYNIIPINASITANTIMPGLNGKKINIEASYKNMKQNGIFNKKLIVYDKILPNISLTNNKDKFIIKGNKNKQMVSLIFILTNNKYLTRLENILNKKEIVANYFIDYNYLINNSTKIKEMTNREFYSYGENGKYTPDNLLFSNNLISRISNNEAIYCISNDRSTEILNICSKNNLYTIVPNIIGNQNTYTLIKNNISNGSIILMYMTPEIMNNLNTIIDYIKSKGYQIEGLSKLLSEELNN